ncbi:MAG: hypothetical protein PHD54_13010 [Desulfuromonadaceae bacterium]|nr:hypothetical protein [Desulfuromonadaceae bacterium]
MKVLAAFTVFFIMSVAVSQAEDILTLGKYVMNDGKMNVAFEVKQIAGGKYFIEGGGTGSSGAMCMMNGVGEFRGGLFAFGYNCDLRLTPVNGKLEIRDEKSCTPCDPGAYISGVYEKK